MRHFHLWQRRLLFPPGRTVNALSHNGTVLELPAWALCAGAGGLPREGCEPPRDAGVTDLAGGAFLVPCRLRLVLCAVSERACENSSLYFVSDWVIYVFAGGHVTRRFSCVGFAAQNCLVYRRHGVRACRICSLQWRRALFSTRGALLTGQLRGTIQEVSNGTRLPAYRRSTAHLPLQRLVLTKGAGAARISLRAVRPRIAARAGALLGARRALLGHVCTEGTHVDDALRRSTFLAVLPRRTVRAGVVGEHGNQWSNNNVAETPRFIVDGATQRRRHLELERRRGVLRNVHADILVAPPRRTFLAC